MRTTVIHESTTEPSRAGTQRPGLLRFAPLTALGIVVAAGVVSEINAPVSAALSAPGTGIPRDQLNLIRCVGGAIGLLLALAITRPRTLRPRLRELPLFAAIGAIGIGVVQYTFTHSLAHISGGAEMFLLLGMAVPFIAVGGYLIGRRALSAVHWAAIGLSLAGLVTLGLVWQSPGLISVGVLLGLASGLGRAVFFLAGERALRDRDALSTSFWAFCFAGLFWILVAGSDFSWSAFSGEISLGGHLTDVTVPRWAALLWEPAIGTALLFTLLLWAVRYLPPVHVAHFGLIEAIAATVITWLWFGTPITGIQALGSLALLAGVALTLRALQHTSPHGDSQTATGGTNGRASARVREGHTARTNPTRSATLSERDATSCI